MKKTYILTFSISFLVVISVCVILLMLMLPQQVQILGGNINKYDAISKSRYTFESTKDISSEALTKQYTITDEDMNTFKNNNQYKAGNSDPFSPSDTVTTGDGNNSSNGSSSNGNNQSSGSTSTQDKITNSNGGTPNPPSTGK